MTIDICLHQKQLYKEFNWLYNPFQKIKIASLTFEVFAIAINNSNFYKKIWKLFLIIFINKMHIL